MVAVRNADATRTKLLLVASQEMREKGFRAASLSEIIGKAGISKGALYHHFLNKQELGYAVFEEVYQQEYFDCWAGALNYENPLDGICELLDMMSTNMSEEDMVVGCPVNSISQEMSSEDEGFRIRTRDMYGVLKHKIASVLALHKERGGIGGHVDIDASAMLIVTGFQGMASMLKAFRDKTVMLEITQGLKAYINSLRK